jgi:hypothetical protein
LKSAAQGRPTSLSSTSSTIPRHQDRAAGRPRPSALDDVDFAAIHQLVGNAVSDPIGLRQSIVVAVLIGELEALGLVGSKFGLEGKFWDFIDQANDNFGCSDIRSSVSSSQAG